MQQKSSRKIPFTVVVLTRVKRQKKLSTHKATRKMTNRERCL